jgi:HSP20 family molecular chaperone IbpA
LSEDSSIDEKLVVPPKMSACLNDKGESYTVKVELPGVYKEDISLTMDKDIIHVVANRDDFQYHGHLHLPYEVQPGKAKSEFISGLLKIKAPLRVKRKPPVKIEIK